MDERPCRVCGDFTHLCRLRRNTQTDRRAWYCPACATMQDQECPGMFVDHPSALNPPMLVSDVEVRDAANYQPSRKAALRLQTMIFTRTRATGPQIRHGGDAYRHCREIADADREMFIVLTLNQRNRVIGAYTISVGTLTASLVHPREVFRPAIIDGAASVVLVHNHPSGNPKPSTQDRDMTDRLLQASQLLGIGVLDHVIIGDGAFVSFRESGWL